jgi:dephospho-CoA kinase
MKIIGLTGGIAVGKSEVAAIFRKYKIPVFDADAAVHKIYRNGVGAKYLLPQFPSAVNENSVDRKKLSEIIAADPSKLKDIEAIIHPLVRQAEVEFLSEAQNSGEAIVVIDSPLLIETNHHKDMDAIILVDASVEEQTKRAMLRPNMTAEKLALIMSQQISSNDKRKHSTFIIENNGSLKDLEAQTRTIINKLREI